jgi:hypothetical protein
MTTANPKDLVRFYHDAFHRRDRIAVRNMLSDIGAFIGPLNSYTDADAFLDGAAIFMKLSKETNIKKIMGEGRDVCVLYDYITIVPSIPTIPIASWFKVESGKINFFHTHFNPIPFLKAKESGEVEKALQQQIKKN